MIYVNTCYYYSLMSIWDKDMFSIAIALKNICQGSRLRACIDKSPTLSELSSLALPVFRIIEKKYYTGLADVFPYIQNNFTQVCSFLPLWPFWPGRLHGLLQLKLFADFRLTGHRARPPCFSSPGRSCQKVGHGP